MRADRWDKWGAVAGLVFFAFIPALFVMAGDQPELGSSPQEVLRFEVDERSSIHAYLVLWCVALIPLIWFLASLLATLRRNDPDDSPLPTVGVVALVLGLVGICTTIILEAAAAFRSADYGPELTRMLWDMSYVFQPVFGIGLGVFLVTMAVLVLRTRILPAWYGWLTLVPALANLVYIGQIAKNDGYFLGEPGFPAFVVWVPLTSILLLRSRRLATRPASERQGSAVAQFAGQH